MTKNLCAVWRLCCKAPFGYACLQAGGLGRENKGCWGCGKSQEEAMKLQNRLQTQIWISEMRSDQGWIFISAYLYKQLSSNIGCCDRDGSAAAEMAESLIAGKFWVKQ